MTIFESGFAGDLSFNKGMSAWGGSTAVLAGLCGTERTGGLMRAGRKLCDVTKRDLPFKASRARLGPTMGEDMLFWQ